ncbi:MAG: response regulator [Parcubacteria group bacterium]|jgi:CheY-like chemotaxis protein
MAEDKKIKILIIDDDDATRSLYAEVFKRHGFDVAEAVDGVEGLDKASINIPDVIFTGIIMPRMDGFALMEALKKNMVTSSIPVAVSSHMGREEDQKRAKELGAGDFIPRDMNTPNEVVERIKVMLNLAKYKIKFYTDELDALKLAQDMHLNEKFQCASCGGEAILSLHLKEVASHEFIAKFVCSKCGKEQD